MKLCIFLYSVVLAMIFASSHAQRGLQVKPKKFKKLRQLMMSKTSSSGGGGGWDFEADAILGDGECAICTPENKIRPNSLVVQYFGGQGAISKYQDEEKATCRYQEFPMQTMVMAYGVTYDNVTDGTIFTILGDNGDFDAETDFFFSECAGCTCYIHTSCSQPLVAGDQIGPFLILEGNGCEYEPVTEFPSAAPSSSPSQSPTVPQPDEVPCNVDVTLECVDSSGQDCSSIEPPQPICSMTSEPMEAVTFSYQDCTCEQSENFQGNDTTCEDFVPIDFTQPVTVACTAPDGAVLDVEPQVVPPGKFFSVTRSSGGILSPNQIECTIEQNGYKTQTNVIDTSGSVSLVLGNKFGALQLEGCDDQNCIDTLTYSIDMNNIGLVDMNITVVDVTFEGRTYSLLEYVGTNPLPVGESTSLQPKADVNICAGIEYCASVVVKADPPNGDSCQDQEAYCFTPPEFEIITSPTPAPSTSPSSEPTLAPSATPSSAPSGAPSASPTSSPTVVIVPDVTPLPTVSPTGQPSASPSSGPTSAPTAGPSAAPTWKPSSAPSSGPTAAPTDDPTASPSAGPTGKPSASPSSRPTAAPTDEPTASPSAEPTGKPSAWPSSGPTANPIASPSSAPSAEPTLAPIATPSSAPSGSPTSGPTSGPSGAPSTSPSSVPSVSPTSSPTAVIVPEVTNLPTGSPSASPSSAPTASPTDEPSASPSSEPTESPTPAPSKAPSTTPSSAPSSGPSLSPTVVVVPEATPLPTGSPSAAPSFEPTVNPIASPSASPSSEPTAAPTGAPFPAPTSSPTDSPTAAPSPGPTKSPSMGPTSSPTDSPTSVPSSSPSSAPTPCICKAEGTYDVSSKSVTIEFDMCGEEPDKFDMVAIYPCNAPTIVANQDWWDKDVYQHFPGSGPNITFGYVVNQVYVDDQPAWFAYTCGSPDDKCQVNRPASQWPSSGSVTIDPTVPAYWPFRFGDRTLDPGCYKVLMNREVYNISPPPYPTICLEWAEASNFSVPT